MEDRFDRIERVLALLLLQGMKGVSQQEKAHQLSVAGFSNVEIADLLETSAQVVSQHLYARKKTKKKKKH
jgi:hypothetical protein